MSPLAVLPLRPWHVSIAAFAAGLAPGEASTGLVLVIATLLAGSLALLRAPRLSAAAAALVLAGAAAGDLRLAALDRQGRSIRDGDRLEARAELLSAPRQRAFGASAEVKVTTGE